MTPEHVVPQVLEALVPAVDQGLRLPLVYNTSAYDSLETLALLEAKGLGLGRFDVDVGGV